VTLSTEERVEVGQQLTCVYHAETIFCENAVLKPEELDKSDIMGNIVDVVQSIVDHTPEEKVLRASYNTRFGKKPLDYSLWTCQRTGQTAPAVTCEWLRYADEKKTVKREQEIKGAMALNSRLKDSTAQTVLAACGPPENQKQDNISKTYVYPSPHKGTLVEVRFTTIGENSDNPKLESLTSVDEGGKFYPAGLLWLNSYANYRRAEPIKDYFPCLK